MSEINPKTDILLSYTQNIGMRLYSFLTNFEMFSYFRSLNCFDLMISEDWIRGKLLVPKRECFDCHTVRYLDGVTIQKLLQSGQMNSGL